MNVRIARVEKLDFMYSSHPITQGVLQTFDTCNFLNEVKYEAFMFLVDSMHQSFVQDGLQFDDSLYEHANSFSHSEHDVEVNVVLYMHYENEGSYFVLPNELTKKVVYIGETNGSDVFILPHKN